MKNQTKSQDKAFFLNAEMLPTSEVLPDYETNSYNEYCVVVEKENGKKKVVNFCSQGYGLVLNKEIFPLLEEYLEEISRVEINREVHLDSQFIVDYTFPDLNFDVKIGRSKVFNYYSPMVRVQHSYNGKLSYTIMLGFYNKTENITVWGSKGNYFTKSHSQGNIEDIIEETFESIKEFIEVFFESAKEDFEKLTNQKVEIADVEIQDLIEKSGFYKAFDSISEYYSELSTRLKDNKYTLYMSFCKYLNMIETNSSQRKERIMKDMIVYDTIINSL